MDVPSVDDNKIALLYSGGLDSCVLLSLALRLKYQPFCILVDYGQVHKAELSYAERLCSELKVPYEKVKVVLPVSSKLTDGEQKYEGVSEWYVPSRNLIFIGLAASLAEDRGIHTIWYGPNYEDRENEFPDCVQEWVFRANQLLEVNGSTPLRLEAPLLGMSKPFIKRLASDLHITEDMVLSGYGEAE